MSSHGVGDLSAFPTAVILVTIAFIIMQAKLFYSSVYHLSFSLSVLSPESKASLYAYTLATAACPSFIARAGLPIMGPDLYDFLSRSVT